MRILSDETSVFLKKFFRKAIYAKGEFGMDVMRWKFFGISTALDERETG
jgi:hypothetical protein